MAALLSIIKNMDRKIIKLAQDFKEMVEKKLGPTEVIIFGSRARGDNDPDSDLDLAVIADRMDDETLNLISDCAWEVGFEAGIVVSPIVFTREEVVGVLKESPICQTIEKEGIRL